MMIMKLRTAPGPSDPDLVLASLVRVLVPGGLTIGKCGAAASITQYLCW